MKRETKSWLMMFLASFLATVLGIVLTFGIDSYVKSKKREETAQMLALQITENMEIVKTQVNSYLDIYSMIDSIYTCVRHAIPADTLDRIDNESITKLLLYSMSEYSQLEAENSLDDYKIEILNTIGDVDLIGHIDNFYTLAQQYVSTSSLVIEQKQKVLDVVYTKFDISDRTVNPRDIVRFFLEMPEYRIFYSRLMEVRTILKEIERQMQRELAECKKILKTEKYSYLHSKLVKVYSILIEMEDKYERKQMHERKRKELADQAAANYSETRK